MRLLAALLALVASTAAAEMNLCWSSSNTWQRCEAGRSVWSRANVAPAQDYSGGAFRDFASVPSSEAVYVCPADRPVGSGAGCPSAGVYTQERFVAKSSLVGALPPPPEPPIPEPPPPSGTGTILMTYAQPTTNTDGSPIGALVANRVYWSTTSLGPGVTASTALVQPPATSYLITGLAPGTWYTAVTAITAGGESELSNVLSKVIDGVPPPPPPPPPADPCVLRPNDFRVLAWVGGLTGDRQPRYTSTKPLKSVLWESDGTRFNRAISVDLEGCSRTVTR